MTRRGKSVWQDDPSIAVGEHDTVGWLDSREQIAPATDEDILRIIDEIDAGTQSGIRNILALIARIKAEREHKVRAHEEMCNLRKDIAAFAKAERKVREQTIRECADLMENWSVRDNFLSTPSERILSLLQSKE